MDSFEFNKIFAAILIAGITAMLGGFIADMLMHPHDLDKNAVEIDGEPVVANTAEMGDPSEQDLVLSLLADADTARGQKLSKACAACHSFDQGGVHKVGPNLWNVVNAQKGHHTDFAYSDALKTHGGTWDFAALNEFLYKPKKYINGTKMNYIGLKKPKDRAAIIAWLTGLSDKPASFPVVVKKEDTAPSPQDTDTELAPAPDAQKTQASPILNPDDDEDRTATH